jgi:hypothetical protein
MNLIIVSSNNILAELATIASKVDLVFKKKVRSTRRAAFVRGGLARESLRNRPILGFTELEVVIFMF